MLELEVELDQLVLLVSVAHLWCHERIHGRGENKVLMLMLLDFLFNSLSIHQLFKSNHVRTFRAEIRLCSSQISDRKSSYLLLFLRAHKTNVKADKLLQASPCFVSFENLQNKGIKHKIENIKKKKKSIQLKLVSRSSKLKRSYLYLFFPQAEF